LVFAVCDGIATLSAISFNCVLAGNCHEVALNCIHPAAFRIAVAPAGKPLTERTATAGSAVPVVGVIETENVAELPGTTGCVVPPPLLADLALSVKSTMDSETAALVMATK